MKTSNTLTGVDTLHDPRFDDEGKLVKPPGPLKAENRESYCLYRAQGDNKTEAYMKAGYKPKDRQRGGMDAHKLETRPDIKARIFELESINVPHDSAGVARSNPEITPEYVNTEMKLLLIQAKQDNNLKLARDIIKDMGREIGLYKENQDTPNGPNFTPLAPSNNGTNQINIQELNQIIETPSDGSGDVSSSATVIDGELNSDTD